MEGVWRTISGRRVFIKKGQSLKDAMRESGKFKDEGKSNSEKTPEEELKEKIKKLEEEYEESRGKERLQKGKELREAKAEYDSLTGKDEERRIKKLRNHSVTIEEERILKQMGVADDYTLDDLEQAIKYGETIKEYTGGQGYRLMRDGSNKTNEVVELRREMENYIKIGDKYKGETYRGVSFADKSDFSTFMANVEQGGVIDMKGISSWSSSESTAKDFASQRKHKIVFVNQDNKSGAEISSLSKYKGEGEVIYSSKSRFLIDGVSKKGEIHYVKVREYDDENG